MSPLRWVHHLPSRIPIGCCFNSKRGANNRYPTPEHLNDAHGQANLETRIKITGGVDNRTSLRTTSDQDLQAMINAIGKITCDAKKRRKANGKFLQNETGDFVYKTFESVGTGTIVIPDRPNTNRAFDTVYTAKHILFNEDGTRRSNCRFISHGGKGKVVGISFPLDFPEIHYGIINKEDAAYDWTIVKTSKRLTDRCSTVEPCGDYLPAAANTSPKIQPWKLGTLSEEEYFEHVVPLKDREGLSDLDTFDYIDGLTTIGFDPGSGRLKGMTSAAKVDKSWRELISGRDNSSRITSFTSVGSNTYVSYEGDTVKGSSGGPLIVRKLTYTKNPSTGKWREKDSLKVEGLISAESKKEDANYLSLVTPLVVNLLEQAHASDSWP